ncbi:hypothetical protein N665_0081s0057 [Sinapis alba]|nr:hypothetical protein N665_0081s0057 [Sinapis alba]
MALAVEEKLPSELVGEILCRLPRRSLARFRAVCKTWDDFWEEKSLLKKYLAHTHPQFILWTSSQICSVNIDEDPMVEVRDLTSRPIHTTSFSHSDGLLLSTIGKKGFVVWNPLLRRWKKKILTENQEAFRFRGIGYDNNSYKIFGSCIGFSGSGGKPYHKVAIYSCKSDAWKFMIDDAPWGMPHLDSIVSLNGNLYWIAYYHSEYFIRSFDFSKEEFNTFCLLPCASEEYLCYTQVLSVFKGDRFSLLRQSYMTRKIEIFVTEHKIDGNYREAVTWICFMTVSIPNFPMLQHKCLDSQPSYFIDNNDDERRRRLFVCTCDETGHACIYIVKGDLFRKIPIDSMVGLWSSHLTYVPSFVPIPLVQRRDMLPLELVGEILCRLPRKSLARSRAVCKTWNSFWEDKSFLKNYLALARPQFILRTKSHICSVDIIDLNDDGNHIVEVHDLTSDIPYSIYKTSLFHCDGFLLSAIRKKGFMIWNPWLREHKKKRLVEIHNFRFCGLGYDNTRPRPTGYKIFGYDFCFNTTGKLSLRVAIYDCKSYTWKFFNNDSCEQGWGLPQVDSIVSVNGNLYWIAYHSVTRQYFIRSFDFSKNIFKTFCLLPCASEEDYGYTQVLSVFRGDRFSLLRQSYMTRKIEIFVTEHKTDGNYREAITWMCFMTVSIPNFPMLQHKCLDSQPSYFIDNDDDERRRRLFVCTCDETGHACIYIVKGDLFRKIPIDSMLDLWPSHLTYIPGFVPIPF